MRSKVCLRLRGAIRYDEGNDGTHKPWSVFLPPVPSNNMSKAFGDGYVKIKISKIRSQKIAPFIAAKVAIAADERVTDFQSFGGVLVSR